jgi:hypothetical protein
MNSTPCEGGDWETEEISASQSNMPVKPGTALDARNIGGI